jgi:hypothetical protein
VPSRPRTRAGAVEGRLIRGVRWRRFVYRWVSQDWERSPKNAPVLPQWIAKQQLDRPSTCCHLSLHVAQRAASACSMCVGPGQRHVAPPPPRHRPHAARRTQRTHEILVCGADLRVQQREGGGTHLAFHDAEQLLDLPGGVACHRLDDVTDHHPALTSQCRSDPSPGGWGALSHRHHEHLQRQTAAVVSMIDYR